MLTKEMTILEVVQKYPQTIPVVQVYGMGCIGCAAAHFENIAAGAAAHNINIDNLMRALNDSVA